MSGKFTKAITDNTFEAEVLQSSIPVLVDFWTTWCGPCKKIAPMLETAAEDYKNQMEIAKIDLGGGMKYAQQYGVTSVPSLLLFKDGEVVASLTGGLSRSQLEQLGSKHVSTGASE